MLDFLYDINIYSIIVRMTLALLFGGIIGIERGLRHRPAGFITYVLVCCTSSLIMITNIYLQKLFPTIDPTRLAAQIVSGIGFLGAGTIIITRQNEIRGLTTAAGLWSAAGIGIALGSGFYTGATIGMIYIMLALTVLKRIDTYVKQHARSMELYLEYDEQFSLNDLFELTEENQFTMCDIEMGRKKTLNSEFGTISFTLGFKRQRNHLKVMEQIKGIEGIINVREISA
jgi:putative Mg2+ transporter-C (MgtC) family protein